MKIVESHRTETGFVHEIPDFGLTEADAADVISALLQKFDGEQVPGIIAMALADRRLYGDPE